jgi:hypothetical protein
VEEHSLHSILAWKKKRKKEKTKFKTTPKHILINQPEA